MSPKERAEAARRTILQAIVGRNAPAARFREQTRRDPLASMGLAVIIGFIIGYSPELRGLVLRNAATFMQAFLRK